CCARRPTSSWRGAMCRQRSSSTNMSSWRAISSMATSLGSSMRCSTSWRIASAPRSSGRRRPMTSSSSDGGPHRLNEFAMIAKYFAPWSKGAAGAMGLMDDVATLGVPEGHELVAKVDAIVEGVHFLRDDPATLVAKKALRVNLSDLAAKGAVPIGYLLSLSL